MPLRSMGSPYPSNKAMVSATLGQRHQPIFCAACNLVVFSLPSCLCAPSSSFTPRLMHSNAVRLCANVSHTILQYPPSTRPPHPRLANRRPLKIGAHRTPLCRAARNRWSDTFQREASLPVSSRGDYFSAWKTESAGKSVIRGLGPSCPVRTGTDNVTSLVTIQRVFLSIQRTIVDNYTCY